MRPILSVFFASSILILAWAPACAAAPRVELELATERGVQITAPQQWLQLLASIGIENVRIRGATKGDVPAATNRGTTQAPSYHVVGILTADNRLRLAGGTFGQGDRERIKDYFDRLAADGAESMTAVRGMFGLTEAEIHAVFDDLSPPVAFDTKGLALRDVLDRFREQFRIGLKVDAGAESIVQNAPAVADNVRGISAGTGLAILLRSTGLVLRPDKPRGQAIELRVLLNPAVAQGDAKTALSYQRAGKTDDSTLQFWPVGWEPHETPNRSAPSLFELLNAEIDGFTLTETLAAIGPRLKVPILLDHAALAANGVDPEKVQVRIPKTRTSYSRVISRAASQARLGSSLRIDEAGHPFLWITR